MQLRTKYKASVWCVLIVSSLHAIMFGVIYIIRMVGVLEMHFLIYTYKSA